MSPKETTDTWNPKHFHGQGSHLGIYPAADGRPNPSFVIVAPQTLLPWQAMKPAGMGLGPFGFRDGFRDSWGKEVLSENYFQRNIHNLVPFIFHCSSLNTVETCSGEGGCCG